MRIDIDISVLELLKNNPKLLEHLTDLAEQNKIMQNEAIEILGIIVNKNKELAKTSPLK